MMNFNQSDSTLMIYNGGELIRLNDFKQTEEGLVYPFPVYDTHIVIDSMGASLHGRWVKNYVDDYEVEFRAGRLEEMKDDDCGIAIPKLDGKYEVTFNRDGKERKAVMLLETQGDSISGTVLTNTGDYRYLHGKITCTQFTLNTFDGENAYHFDVQITPRAELEGDFYSGKTRHETFYAVLNDDFQLDDPTTIGSSDSKASGMQLIGWNMQGEKVSFEDLVEGGQPAIIQLLGTWCPNCMDEAAFMSRWLKEHPDLDLAVVGVAFELKDDLDYARTRIQAFSDKHALPYDIVFAGKKSRENVQRVFPFLDGVIAYPTTIYLNRDHEVEKIYTGFSGPASGAYHEKFVREFESTVEFITGQSLTPSP